MRSWSEKSFTMADLNPGYAGADKDRVSSIEHTFKTGDMRMARIRVVYESSGTVRLIEVGGSLLKNYWRDPTFDVAEVKKRVEEAFDKWLKKAQLVETAGW